MPLVFDTKPGSGYDDRVDGRYQFPNRYFPAANAGVGDWIVYRKPRRGDGEPGYFGVARLDLVTAAWRLPFEILGGSSTCAFRIRLTHVASARNEKQRLRPRSGWYRSVPGRRRQLGVAGLQGRAESPVRFSPVTGESRKKSSSRTISSGLPSRRPWRFGAHDRLRAGANPDWRYHRAPITAGSR